MFIPTERLRYSDPFTRTSQRFISIYGNTEAIYLLVETIARQMKTNNVFLHFTSYKPTGYFALQISQLDTV